MQIASQKKMSIDTQARSKVFLIWTVWGTCYLLKYSWAEQRVQKAACVGGILDLSIEALTKVYGFHTRDDQSYKNAGIFQRFPWQSLEGEISAQVAAKELGW